MIVTRHEARNRQCIIHEASCVTSDCPKWHDVCACLNHSSGKSSKRLCNFLHEISSCGECQDIRGYCEVEHAYRK